MEQQMIHSAPFELTDYHLQVMRRQEQFTSEVYFKEKCVFVSYPYPTAELAERAAKDYYIQLNKQA